MSFGSQRLGIGAGVGAVEHSFNDFSPVLIDFLLLVLVLIPLYDRFFSCVHVACPSMTID